MNLYSILEEIITWFDAQHYEPCDAVDDCPFRYEYDGVIEAGSSKIVFIPNEGEYVYKISSNYVEGDYCYREAENYKLAKEQGVDELFIATEYFTTIADHDVYIQKKIATNGDKINTKEYKTSGSYYMDEHEGKRLWHYFDESSLGAIIDYYGVDIAEKLISFVIEYDINDLTSYNCTIDDKGEVKFFDYAGYGKD